MTKTKLAASAAAIATLLACGSALAASPLAQYSQLPGDPGASLAYTNGVLSTPTGGYQTQFSFQVAGLPTTNLNALFTLNATATQNAFQTPALGTIFDAQRVGGSFSFVYNGTTPFTVGGTTYTTGTTLLSGTFDNGEVYGVDAGSTASFADSRLDSGIVNLTSGISAITFNPGGDESFSLALDSVTPDFMMNGANLGNFTSASAGVFGADVTIGGGGGGVPEAATWVMMILGVGLVGANMRRRRSTLVEA